MAKQSKPLVTFIVDCPNCKVKVAATEEGRAERGGFDHDVGEPYGQAVSVGPCPRCKTLLVGVSHQTSFAGYEGEEYDEWTEPVRAYPDPPKTFASHRIPRVVTVSLTEGSNALQAGAAVAAAVMFGRALEGVCRDILFTPNEKKAIRKGELKKQLMLTNGIKQLREKNVIDDRLYDWSQQLNAFRNIAAHPDGENVTISRQDGEDLQAFAHAIIEYIYDLPERYEEFRERRAKQEAAKKKTKSISELFGSDED